MGNEEKLKILIEAKNKAKAAFDEAERQLQATQKSVGGLNSRLNAASAGSKKFAKALGVASAAGAVAFGVLAKKSFDAYNVQQRAEAQLIQLHHRVTGATMEQTKSLFAQASALQKVGVIGDEAIIAGQAQLATFKLSTSAIKNLTPAMADMVAKYKGVNATGEDFTNIGNLIGRVMTGNVGALTRYGVTLDEHQKQLIKDGDETQRSAVLAEVLAQNYGGVNKALRNTPEGKIKALKNRIGDLQEGFGMLVAKVLVKVADWFDKVTTAIEKAGGIAAVFRKAIEKFKTPLTILAGAIVGALIPAMVAWTISLWSAATGAWALLAPMLPFIAAGALIALGVQKIVQATGGWSKLWERMQPIIENLKKSVVSFAKAFKSYWDSWVFPGIKTLGQLIGWLWKSVLQPTFKFIGSAIKSVVNWWNGLSDGVKKAIQKIAIVVGVIVVALNAPIVALIAFGLALLSLWQKSETFRKIVTSVWNAIVAVIKFAWNNVIQPIWNLIVAYITNVLVPVWTKIFQVAKWVWDKIYQGIQVAWTYIQPIWELIKSYITNTLIPTWQKIYSVVKWVWDNVWQGIQIAWSYIQPVFQAIWGFITNTLVPVFQSIWNKVSEVFTWVWNKISGFITNVRDGFIKVKDWVQGLIDKFVSAKDKIGSAFTNVANAIKAPFKTAFNGVIGLWNKTLGKISFTIPSWVPGGLGGKKFSMPKIDTLYTGVRNYKGGPAVVGDIRGRGGEIINMPRGTDVYNNRQSKQILDALANGGSSSATFNMYGTIKIENAEAADKFFERLNALSEMSKQGVPVG